LANIILHPEYQLYEKGGTAFCSSRQVAETFRKRHDHVLRDIENLDCSTEFKLPNFGETSYKDNMNRKQPEILMTKDGFTFLAMGYRGKKAAAFKEAYIKRFNEMDGFIKDVSTAKIEYPAFTAAVMLTHEEPKHYHFSNEVDMINRIVLGMSAKKFKQMLSIPEDTPSIRPYLEERQVNAIITLQRADIGMLVTTPNFEERKRLLADYYARLSQRALLA
jgi:Rha family phage regulatory protein